MSKCEVVTLVIDAEQTRRVQYAGVRQVLVDKRTGTDIKVDAVQSGTIP